MNQVTHFLDGSQIYGSTFSKTASLRQYVGGRLNTSKFEDRTFLPKSLNPTTDCQVTSEDSTCFLSGDHRVNIEPRTVAMYTVWVREHNRVAKELAALNPLWADETIFQEARRIVTAEIQHITYKEWLPLILGRSKWRAPFVFLSMCLEAVRFFTNVSHPFTPIQFKPLSIWFIQF